MKIKKVLILMTILVTCSARWPTIVLGQQEKEQSQSVEQLQEKINELEKTIKAQQQTIGQAQKAYERVKKQLDEQVKENERLKTLCEKAGINTAKIADASFNPSDIVYRGEKRTQQWFDRMYERFSDKIIYWDGKYIDVGEQLAGVCNLDSDHFVWPVGTPVQFSYDSEVISVLKGGVLISNGYKYGENLVIHIHNLDGTYVVGQVFPADIRLKLIYTGTFEYEAALGRKMTVPSLTPYRPLTKEQFAEAINNGIKLVEYERVVKDNQGVIYKESDYDFYSDVYGNLGIKKGSRTVREIPKGAYHHEIIGKPIR